MCEHLNVHHLESGDARWAVPLKKGFSPVTESAPCASLELYDKHRQKSRVEHKTAKAEDDHKPVAGRPITQSPYAYGVAGCGHSGEHNWPPTHSAEERPSNEIDNWTWNTHGHRLSNKAHLPARKRAESDAIGMRIDSFRLMKSDNRKITVTNASVISPSVSTFAGIVCGVISP